jgi:hypothetical protein
MAYGSNMLKRDAAYYDLHNASIINGILTIEAGGYATQTITVSDLPAITDKMLFSAIAEPYADHYAPEVYVRIMAKCSDGQYYEAVLYPNDTLDTLYSCEFSLKAGEYSDMTVTIGASDLTTFLLWELCAEAADETTMVEIEGVKQSLAKVLYDYNTGTFVGDQEETTLAFITCRLLQNTDVQGHFLCAFKNTHACCMTVRFYDNNSEELFSPLHYDLKPGYNSIDIPHAFLTRLAGPHNFFVTAQVSSGTFTVETRGALFTIDAGYLASREVPLAMDITDIAIKQTVADEGPSEIYAVGVDKGVAYVRSRSYKETNVNVAWTAIGTLGPASSAAVEFDGDWVLRPETEQYTIETEDEPWYFWVNNSILYAIHGLPSELNTPTILSHSVQRDIKVVKGYGNISLPERDQGLIVCYIDLDGYPKYCSYAYDAIAGRKVWAGPFVLPVLPYKYDYVNVHRLNDYRVAFELSGTENVWILSSRTYVGQSVLPEVYSGCDFYEELDEMVPYCSYRDANYNPPNDIHTYNLVMDEYDETTRYTTTTYYWYHYIYGDDILYEMVCKDPPRIGASCSPDPITGAERTIIGDIYSRDNQLLLPVRIFDVRAYVDALEEWHHRMDQYEQAMVEWRQAMEEWERQHELHPEVPPPERPEEPERPDESDYASTADIPVKKIGIDSTTTETTHYYRYRFDINYPIFGSETFYPIFDRITESGFNERYAISDIKWDVYSDHTTVSVICVLNNEEKEASTIRTFAIPVDGMKTLRVRDTRAPHYISPVQNDITAVFDITNYVVSRNSAEFETAIVSVNSTLRSVAFPKGYGFETFEMLLTPDTTYSAVVFTKGTGNETYALEATISTAYYKSGEEPI